MNKTENKTSTHKEPLFSFKTAVSVKEVEGLNNHVYETLRSKIEDLKRKGYDTWELEAEVLKLDSARREISSSVKRIANLINGAEPKKEEESHTNTAKLRAWHKKRKAMVKVISINFENSTAELELETPKESSFYWYTSTCKLEDIVLMQSTGICDTKGVEVFEGDIVFVLSDAERRYFHLLGTVEKVKGCWTIVGEEGISYPLYSEGIIINVRGNIHEAKVNEMQENSYGAIMK